MRTPIPLFSFPQYLLKYYLEIGIWNCLKNDRGIYKQKRLSLLILTGNLPNFLSYYKMIEVELKLKLFYVFKLKKR